MLYPFCMVQAGRVSGKNTNRVALLSACMILCIFMAIREKTVGVDTKFYCYVFNQFSKIPWNRIFTAKTYATEAATWTFDFEPGYRLYNKILSCFSDKEQFITIGNSVVIFILLYRLIVKNSPNYLLSVWLYITLGVYQTEMNVARNAIAILLVYNAFQFIEQRQWKKYVLCCILASTFHMTAILFLPVYWIIHKLELSVSKCGKYIVVCVIIGAMIPVIRPYLIKILPYSYQKYIIGGRREIQSILIGILNAGIFGLSYLLNDTNNRKNIWKNEKIGTTMLFLNLCCFAFTVGFGYASRLAALFGPYLIITISQIVHEIKDIKKRNMATAFIVVVSGIIYIARLFVNNIGGTMPYRFFWQ